jgi:hypothetical protein
VQHIAEHLRSLLRFRDVWFQWARRCEPLLMYLFVFAGAFVTIIGRVRCCIYFPDAKKTDAYKDQYQKSTMMQTPDSSPSPIGPSSLIVWRVLTVSTSDTGRPVLPPRSMRADVIVLFHTCSPPASCSRMLKQYEYLSFCVEEIVASIYSTEARTVRSEPEAGVLLPP